MNKILSYISLDTKCFRRRVNQDRGRLDQMPMDISTFNSSERSLEIPSWGTIFAKVSNLLGLFEGSS